MTARAVALAAGVLLLLAGPLALAQTPPPDAGAAASAAYRAWSEGDFAEARDLAQAAILIDGSVASLVARRVLVLSLEQLGEPAQALWEVERYLEFDLLPADKAWADEAAARLRLAAAEGTLLEPGTDPGTEPGTRPEDPDSEPEPRLATPPSHPVLVVSVGAGPQQMSRWSYITPGVGLSVRLVGPLRLGAAFEMGIAPGQPCPDGVGDCSALLSTISIGPQLRASGAIASPFAAAGFVVGLNGGLSPYPRVVMPGFSVGGGVELGTGPVAARLRADFRVLGPLAAGASPQPGVLLAAEFALRAGGRTP